jgi:Family of unknown function (DUF6535)
LLAVTIQDIRPSLQGTSAFYLAHIYQQSSTQPNGSRPSIPSSLPDPTKPFSPPTSAVWVNGFWFLSLVINLSCALLATSIQQWARQFERVANPRYGPHKRARIHAFYKEGIEKWQFPMAIEVLPMLLHISLFLFFAGLSVFLFGVNGTIFKAVSAWIGLCVISYAGFSFFPVIQKNALYSTPLSVPFFFCLTGIRYLFFVFFFRLRSFPHINIFIRMLLPSSHPGEIHLGDFFSSSMAKTAEQHAFMKPDIDHRLLWWTFESLDEDAEYEEFFEGLPRLCDSDTGDELELKNKFIEPNKEKLSNTLIGLMDRTLISNLVKESVKHRRMIIFTRVIESTSLLDPSRELRRVLFGDWHGFLECIEFGLFMQKWANTSNDDRVTSFYAQCVASLTISSISIIENRDKRWIQLATVDRQPLSRSLHPDEDHHSILLANAIHVVRMSVQTYSGSEVTRRSGILNVSLSTLGAVCKLDIRHTLPELQNEFCDLWNKLVRMAQTDQLPHHRSVSVKMLKNIRNLYIALHETPRTAFNTTYDSEQILDNSGFYPECTDNDHRSSTSFPDLLVVVPGPQTQVDASIPMQFPQPLTPRITSGPSSPPAQPTPSDVHMQFPLPLTQPITSGPSSPPAEPSPSDTPMQFPQPYSPSLLIPSNPAKPPAQPPSPPFPVVNP